MNKKVIIVLIIAIVLIISLLLIFFKKPEETYKQKVNNQLKEEQILTLIKYSAIDLVDYNNMQSGTITTDQMVKFALSYITVLQEEQISYVDNGYTAVVGKNLIEDKVRYIFDKKIDYNNLTYKTDDNYIYIPKNMTGGDAQIYKYRTKEYNEQENSYTVYIDVLEAGPSRYSQLEESSVTEYNEEDVLTTLIFKYKQLEDRKVLLSYNVIQNW